MLIIVFFNRYHQKAPTPWTGLILPFLFFVIGLLVGYILYGAAIHIVKVEDDFHEMERLKVRAEAADVAKSQVLFHGIFFTWIINISKDHFLISVSDF